MPPKDLDRLAAVFGDRVPQRVRVCPEIGRRIERRREFAVDGCRVCERGAVENAGRHSKPRLSLRAKRSNPSADNALPDGDCFVAPLLAMTALNEASLRHV